MLVCLMWVSGQALDFLTRQAWVRIKGGNWEGGNLDFVDFVDLVNLFNSAEIYKSTGEIKKP